MAEKKELTTFTETKKSKDQICFIQVQRRTSRSYYIISAFEKTQFLLFIYISLPSLFGLLLKSPSFGGQCLFNVARMYLQLLSVGFFAPQSAIKLY